MKLRLIVKDQASRTTTSDAAIRVDLEPSYRIPAVDLQEMPLEFGLTLTSVNGEPIPTRIAFKHDFMPTNEGDERICSIEPIEVGLGEVDVVAGCLVDARRSGRIEISFDLHAAAEPDAPKHKATVVIDVTSEPLLSRELANMNGMAVGHTTTRVRDIAQLLPRATSPQMQRRLRDHFLELLLTRATNILKRLKRSNHIARTDGEDLAADFIAKIADRWEASQVPDVNAVFKYASGELQKRIIDLARDRRRRDGHLPDEHCEAPLSPAREIQTDDNPTGIHLARNYPLTLRACWGRLGNRANFAKWQQCMDSVVKNGGEVPMDLQSQITGLPMQNPHPDVERQVRIEFSRIQSTALRAWAVEVAREPAALLTVAAECEDERILEGLLCPEEHAHANTIPLLSKAIRSLLPQLPRNFFASESLDA